MAVSDLNLSADPLKDLRTEHEAKGAKETAAEAKAAEKAAEKAAGKGPAEKKADAAEAGEVVEEEAEEGEAEESTDGDAAEEGEEGEPEKKAAPKEDWRDRARKRDTAKRKAAEEERDAAVKLAQDTAKRVAELELLLKTPAGERPEPKAKTEAEIRREVEEELRGQRGQEDAVARVNERNQRIGKAAIAAYGAEAFDKAAEQLNDVFANDAERLSFIEAADATDNPAKVLFTLGQNPDEAERILALSPAKMAIAMAKIAEAVAPKKPVSAAPKPVKPIGSNQGEQTGALRVDMSDAAFEKGVSDMLERVAERRSPRLR